MSGDLRLVPMQGITEDDLALAQPVVRALVHTRLEEVWDFCEPHLRGEVDRPDARMAELALRTLKELKDLYRLGSPQQPTPPPEDRTPQDVAIAKIREDMLALEARHG